MSDTIKQLSIGKVLATVEYGICFTFTDANGIEYICPLTDKTISEIPGALENAKIAVEMHKQSNASGFSSVVSTVQ